MHCGASGGLRIRDYVYCLSTFWQGRVVLLDITGFRPAIANAQRSLKREGRFISSLEHPSNDVIGRSEVPFQVMDYFTERAFPRAYALNFHRTLETYDDAVADCGGLIERIKEPRLASDVAALHPERTWPRLLPAFIVIKARLAMLSSDAVRT